MNKEFIKELDRRIDEHFANLTEEEFKKALERANYSVYQQVDVSILNLDEEICFVGAAMMPSQVMPSRSAQMQQDSSYDRYTGTHTSFNYRLAA